MHRTLYILLLLILLPFPAGAQLIPYPSTSPLYSQPDSASPGELRLPEARANGTNYTAIKAPASIAVDVTFTWPGVLPTSTGCFSSDTQGVLSIIACVSLTDANAWTGVNTFTSSSGVQLKPYGTVAGNTTELRLLELAANGTNYVGVKAPDALAANTIWTLPSADASGCLKSNGSGVLSITTCSTDLSGIAYVVVTADATLTAERVLTAGTGVSLTDAGANSTLTLANTGVTSNVAGTGISVSGPTGAVTVTNTGIITVSCTTLSCSGTNPAAFSIADAAITNVKLANSSITVQGVAVALGGSTLPTTGTPQFASLGLGGAAGATDLKLYGSTSGSTVLKASAVAGATTVTLPATTGTAVTTGDTGTVTNTMLAGSITAVKLVGTDIATVGTITTGTWSGTTVAVASGGTGLTSGTSGGVLAYTATGTLASSGALTANALVLGGGAGVVPTVMASLGTTTTVLHGNALGAPTFGAVALGTDVSGTLAAAQFPALTGDVTTVAGALATTIGAAKVTNAMLAGSIAASKLVGTDIATVGTVTAGTWNATIVTSAYGGTGNGFTKFAGPATTEKTFTLPNATSTILTTNDLVTVAQGGSGVGTFTLNGVLYGNGTGAVQVTAQGGTNTLLSASAGAPSFSASPILNTSLQLGVVSSTTGSLKLANSASANLTIIQAGNATAAVTYTWPTADGTANQQLQTNGAGVLSWVTDSGGTSFANPTASVGLTAVNGVATTAMRSDAAPPLSQGIAPTWTDQHTWSAAGTGPKIRLTDADSQIFIGTTTDSGWTVPAIKFGSLAEIWSTAASGGQLVLSMNVYSDGTQKYASTGTVGSFIMDNGGATAYKFRWSASGTVDTAITWTDEVTMGSSGTTHGAPTGGAKGSGTINATAVYDDNVLLTDWAFDLYYDGRARERDPFYRGQRLYPFAETVHVTSTERRLPWMPTRDQFEAERSLGRMVSSLWFGQEQQQMYLMDLERRVTELETLTGGVPHAR